ncbi:MAG: hypothetical protein N2645_04005 [Clostridia bacterium]|nr:hypothetical protein [Clostridia bacterium]
MELQITRPVIGHQKKNIKSFFEGSIEFVRLVWKGAAVGGVIGCLLFFGYLGAVTPMGLTPLAASIILCGAAAVVIILAGVLAVLIFLFLRLILLGVGRLLGKMMGDAILIPYRYIKKIPLSAVAVFSGITVVICMVNLILFNYKIILCFILLQVLTGITISYTISRKPKRWMRVFLPSIPLAIQIVALVWYFSPEIGENTYIKPQIPKSKAVFGVMNPGERGKYKIKTLLYGSGTDKNRKEYGALVNLKTYAVDVSGIMTDNAYNASYPMSQRVQRTLRKWFWGFDTAHFPLNGRVWYPEGQGPFPLVLIVHGNHPMEEFSDAGYGYLGELLASRGFIAVSVDENFLNGSWSGDLPQPTNSTLRAWMLLKHLEIWKEWNQDAGNPFYQQIDMENIALIGHSRGGEAAAIAALFNQNQSWPEHSKVKFDERFSIRAVAAIAPSDTYKPGGSPFVLTDTSYLVLQGNYDADVSCFQGYKTYQRVRFFGKGDYFKAAVYIQRANHGQFNTIWGKYDVPGPKDRVLNITPLLSGEEQREIAKVYLSAFLETTLHGNREYTDVFRASHAVYGWLPQDIYVTQYEDASFETICDYEEDSLKSTASISGGTVEGRNLKEWKEEEMFLRDKGKTPQGNKAVFLRWENSHALKEKVPVFSISLPSMEKGLLKMDDKTSLTFSAANGIDMPAFTDLTVELTDRNGSTACLPLSRYSLIPPSLKAKLSKWQWLDAQDPEQLFETVFQSFEIPVKEFVRENNKLKLNEISKISFKFDKTPSGAIWLDKIGIQRDK